MIQLDILMMSYAISLNDHFRRYFSKIVNYCIYLSPKKPGQLRVLTSDLILTSLTILRQSMGEEVDEVLDLPHWNFWKTSRSMSLT